MHDFHTELAEHQIHVPGAPLGEMEASREVIFFAFRKTPHVLKGFDETHSIIYNNVRIYEKGKMSLSHKMENMTIEERLFGGRR